MKLILSRYLREAIRLKHYSNRTEETSVHWIKRYIFYHHKRHPQEMGVPEIAACLTHLAVVDEVGSSCARVFGYRRFRNIPPDRLDRVALR